MHVIDAEDISDQPNQSILAFTSLRSSDASSCQRAEMSGNELSVNRTSTRLADGGPASPGTWPTAAALDALDVSG